MGPLTDLPETLFLEIFEYLSPSEVVLCRRISRDIHHALTRLGLCQHLLLSLLPRSRETRLLRSMRDSVEDTKMPMKDWPSIFAVAARRHHHQTRAVPFFIQDLPLLQDPAIFKGVSPWDMHLRFNEHIMPLHHQDPVWTYGVREGLLVYPRPAQEYCALVLATGRSQPVPFGLKGRIIRRVRLNDGVLVFEWAEAKAFHQLNENEVVHRHFATAFDVWTDKGEYDSLPDLQVTMLGTVADDQPKPYWRFALRAEWKIHYLGLPLAASDRPFSAHNATHFVLYVWQPNRSPWGEDSPLERLTIWDLGDPKHSESDLSAAAEPQIIRSLTNEDLDPWGLRQSDTPSLRSLALDKKTHDPLTGQTAGHLFFITEEHCWAEGTQSPLAPSRLHRVRATGVPLQGHGPVWAHECSGDAFDAACREGMHAGEEDEWPGWAPCWRHENFPYPTVSQVVDRAAGLRFCARRCFMMEVVSVNRHLDRDARRMTGKPSEGDVAGKQTTEEAEEHAREEADDSGLEREARFSDEIWGRIMERGQIAGDERWLIGEGTGRKITVLHF